MKHIKNKENDIKTIKKERKINIKVITNRLLCDGRFVDIITKIAEEKLVDNFVDNGEKLDSIVLREKDLTVDKYRTLASEINAICKENKVDFFIHRHYELLDELEIRKVHLPLNIFKSMIEENKHLSEGRLIFDEIGISIHSAEEAIEVEKILSDKNIFEYSNFKRAYVTAGNIFETTCKPGKAARGTEFLKEVIASTEKVEVYAIGGINEYNIAEVSAIEGLSGVCIMSGAMKLYL